MTLELDAKRVASQLDDDLGDEDVFQKAVRDIAFTCQHPFANAANEFTLVASTPTIGYVVGCSFTTETTQAVLTDSLEASLLYDDGAGGVAGATALATAYSGVTSGVTANETQDLAQTAAHQVTEIPAGSRIYLDVAQEVAGAAWDATVVQLRFRQK